MNTAWGRLRLERESLWQILNLLTDEELEKIWKRATQQTGGLQASMLEMIDKIRAARDIAVGLKEGE